MSLNRPQGRKRGSSVGSGNVHKRGSGLGTGMTGNSGRPGGSGGPRRGGGVTRGAGGIGILALIFMLLFRGGGGALSGGSSSGTSGGSGLTVTQPTAPTTQGTQSNGFSFGTPASHTSYTTNVTTPSADTTVAKEARDKYTKIRGNGKDEVTILVYMCGADLESKYGMATADLTEMANAQMSDKVNIIVETGGAKKWQTSAISNTVLQRWKVGSKSIEVLDKNVGKGAMTDPQNLVDFVKWGVKEYPADRYELIFWDHGGGSVSGYGCDELYPNGSMSLDEIADALKQCKVKFDFVGFDACLMANYEAAVALEPYADYMIASEEAEPGTGWYYTDWLTTLAQNTSTPTVEIGKEIVDTFISASLRSSSRASVTLSVVDLAELEGTATDVFNTFAKELSSTISSENLKTVADARSCTKEFAAQMSIDQIDLIHFCDNLGTKKSQALAKALRSAVKYNKTQNISNSYGLSIYFPYKNTRMVSNVLKVYGNMGFDTAYTGAVKAFGTSAASGNIYNSNTQNSLFNILGGGQPSTGSSSVSANDLFSLLSGLSSGSTSGSSSTSYGSGWNSWSNAAGGYSGSGSNVLDLGSLLGGSSSSIDTGALQLISSLLTGRASLPADDLVFTESNGQQVLRLSEDDWANVHDIALSVWVDDGQGYIDLGLDAIYNFNEDGELIADYDRMWVALDGQPCSYFITTAEYAGEDEYIYAGYVPAYLNGELVRIHVQWTDEDPDGVVLGAESLNENGTMGKGLIEIGTGDEIDLVCDYYTYEGEYQDSYYLGETITVNGELSVGDIDLTNSDYVFCYKLTDTLGNARWTQAVRAD